jgi:hypothetical protein
MTRSVQTAPIRRFTAGPARETMIRALRSAIQISDVSIYRQDMYARKRDTELPVMGYPVLIAALFPAC